MEPLKHFEIPQEGEMILYQPSRELRDLMLSGIIMFPVMFVGIYNKHDYNTVAFSSFIIGVISNLYLTLKNPYRSFKLREFPHLIDFVWVKRIIGIYFFNEYLIITFSNKKTIKYLFNDFRVFRFNEGKVTVNFTNGFKSEQGIERTLKLSNGYVESGNVLVGFLNSKIQNSKLVNELVRMEVIKEVVKELIIQDPSPIKPKDEAGIR